MLLFRTQVYTHMTILKLTDKQAKAETWEGKDRLLAVGDSLYLNVRRSSKTWIIRRATQGKMMVRTIGKYPEMSVRAARACALAALLKENPSNLTVGELAERYFTEVVEEEQRRPELVRGYLDRAILPELGARRVIELTSLHIASMIQRYRVRGPRSADQLRTVTRSLMRYAVEIGVRPDNPAAALTRRVSGYKPQDRERVLADGELRQVWAIAHDNGRLLRFLLLTGLRISEARLGERHNDRWCVTAALSKNGKAHWVHLTPTALAQLPLPRVSATAVQAWVKRWCEREQMIPFTPHDCRRTAATRMGDGQVQPFIIERAINHTLQGVMGIYNRAEYEQERIAAAQTLERVLLEVVTP